MRLPIWIFTKVFVLSFEEKVQNVAHSPRRGETNLMVDLTLHQDWYYDAQVGACHKKVQADSMIL
jgi:hypothetical protein